MSSCSSALPLIGDTLHSHTLVLGYIFYAHNSQLTCWFLWLNPVIYPLTISYIHMWELIIPIKTKWAIEENYFQEPIEISIWKLFFSECNRIEKLKTSSKKKHSMEPIDVSIEWNSFFNESNEMENGCIWSTNLWFHLLFTYSNHSLLITILFQTDFRRTADIRKCLEKFKLIWPNFYLFSYFGQKHWPRNKVSWMLINNLHSDCLQFIGYWTHFPVECPFLRRICKIQ